MARKAQRRKAATRPADGAARPRGGDDHIIDAAMTLAGTNGWRRTGLADIAAEAGLSLAELYGRFRSKGAILDAFVQRIDRETLAGADKIASDDTTSVRDRLFDLIMRRFDALAPHKAAVASLARDLPASPMAALCTGGRLCRSMAWMASVAGVSTSGPLGLLRIKGLVAVYLYVMRVWLHDDSDDHAKTMSALDAALRRAEMFAQSVPASFPFKRPRRASAS